MQLIAGLSTEKYLLFRISTILSPQVHQLVLDARTNLLRVDQGTKYSMIICEPFWNEWFCCSGWLPEGFLWTGSCHQSNTQLRLWHHS